MTVRLTVMLRSKGAVKDAGLGARAHHIIHENGNIAVSSKVSIQVGRCIRRIQAQHIANHLQTRQGQLGGPELYLMEVHTGTCLSLVQSAKA